MPQLLLLHGFTGSPLSWSRIIRLLPSGSEVFVPPLPGHAGRAIVGPGGEASVTSSEPPQASSRAVVSPAYSAPAASFSDRCAQVLDWAESAGFRRGLVVGYSLGARFALGMLDRDPTHFSGALLIGVHPGLTDPEQRRARLMADQQRIEALRAKPLDEFLEAWQAQPLFASQRRLSDELLQEQRLIRSTHNADGLAASLRDSGLGQMPNYADLFRRLSIPVQLAVGGEDHKFGEIARALVKASPRCMLCVVDGCGHNLLLEQPTQIAQLIVDLLPPQ